MSKSDVKNVPNHDVIDDPILTTLALGEEGGCWDHDPIGDVYSPVGGPFDVTTLAIGKEGGPCDDIWP